MDSSNGFSKQGLRNHPNDASNMRQLKYVDNDYAHNILIPVWSARLNTRDLQAFVAVVDSGSMVRAAEKLHLTQPGLTRRVQNLKPCWVWNCSIAKASRSSQPLRATRCMRWRAPCYARWTIYWWWPLPKASRPVS